MENLKTERVGSCVIQFLRGERGPAKSYRTYYRIEAKVPNGSDNYCWIHRETVDVDKAIYWFNSLIINLKKELLNS